MSEERWLCKWSEGIYDSTSIKDFLCCKRRGYLRWVLGLQPINMPAALAYGIAAHEGLDVLYGEGTTEDAIRAAVGKLGSLEFTETTKRNAYTLAELIESYSVKYDMPVEKNKTEQTEVQFAIAMPNGTIYSGRLDRTLIDNGARLVCDYKTSAYKPSSKWFTTFDNDFQLLGYSYANRSITGDCTGYMVDAMRVDANAADCFAREQFPVTNLQYEEWENTYIYATNAIRSLIQKMQGKDPLECIMDWPCEHTACKDWGGCVYKDACIYGPTSNAVKITMTMGAPDRKADD